jgi:hypothetical protein
VGEQRQEVEKFRRRGVGNGKVGKVGQSEKGGMRRAEVLLKSGKGGAEAEKVGMEGRRWKSGERRSRRWKSGREGVRVGKVGENEQGGGGGKRWHPNSCPQFL